MGPSARRSADPPPARAAVARTPAVKVLPPAAAPGTLPRPELQRRLDEALARRLTTLIAGAGFGKSTLLAAWAGERDAAWYTVDRSDASLPILARGVADALRSRVPGLGDRLAVALESPRGPDTDERGQAQAIASLVCEALQEALPRDLALVLDDADELAPASAPAALVEALVRLAPSRLHLVLASRSEPPFPIARLRGQGQVLELTGATLALGQEEVAALLAGLLDPGAVELAGRLGELTGGWPAAVRLAIEALRAAAPAERSRALERIGRPEGPLYAWLAGEVFAREPEATVELVRRAAHLERFTAELCAAVGVPDAAATLVALAHRGLFLEERGEPGWYGLLALVREFALRYLPLDADATREVHRRAAAWLTGRGLDEEALAALAAADDAAGMARLLHERGLHLVAAGRVEAVIRAVERLPAGLRDPPIERLAGEARLVRGDWEGALDCYRRAGGEAETLESGLAWRMGLIYHKRGELDEALRVYGRGRIDGTSPRDDALLLAWSATVHWLLGHVDPCRELARRAHETASAIGDPQALAAAHIALAMLAVLDGDRRANEAHYLRALEEAERAGDLLQVVRIHNNRARKLVEEGAYADAIAEADVAIHLADLTGYASFHAYSLASRGEARFHLGRLEEAIADQRASRAILERIGSRWVAYPLLKQADVQRARGELALARAGYEEAIGLAERSGDLQALVPALTGLARLLIDEEPEQATRLSERAVGLGPGIAHVEALVVAARVALARGERERAAGLAAEAATAARARRERPRLAEALELQGLMAGDPERTRARLEEAAAFWRELGDPIGEARVQVSLARTIGGSDGRALAEGAERTLRALGGRGGAARAADLVAALGREARPAVEIRALGGFRIVRDGRPVPVSEWQSRKARDLLKILVARRGRPVPREELAEALWPEEAPERLANRLSVALATVRTVLDPGRRHGPEHFVAADRGAVALQLDHVAVDAEAFLAGAAAGLQLRREGRTGEADARLAAAEAAYTGDFLEEDPYADWAVPLREESRAAYIAVARALAEDAAAQGDDEAAIRYRLRILERDPYDEAAHLGLVGTLVAGRRHGEARRSYRTYAARMAEIGVEAAPFPARP